MVGNADGRGVGVVLVVAAFDAIVIDPVVFNQDVLGLAVVGADEEAVSGVP